MGVLVVLLMLAGCAAKTGGVGVATADGKPSAAASSAPAGGDDSDKDAALKFSQCMREHGMTWFPDPKPGAGGLQIRVPQGTDKAKMDAAMAACKKFMPNGGEPDKDDPARLEQMRQLSKCMRANGVPDFPDPSPNGEMHVDGSKLGISPDDPAFKAAEKNCAKYQPKPPPGDGNGDGPGTVTG